MNELRLIEIQIEEAFEHYYDILKLIVDSEHFEEVMMRLIEDYLASQFNTLITREELLSYLNFRKDD